MDKNLSRNFAREIKKLRALYNGSRNAFPKIGKELNKKIHSREKEKNLEKVYLNDVEEDKFFIAGNSYELVNKYKNGFKKNIREISIIRAISALEVLLVDLVREIFLHKKHLFHSRNKIEFSHSELLSSKSISKIWSKVINKECRRLQNQGFQEIQKYYKKFFSIDFNGFQTKPSDIQYIHEIRHLLVHRLGKTDKYFRHKYNVSTKNVQLTEEKFYDYLDKIEKFGEEVIKKADNLIQSPTTDTQDKFDTKCHIKIQLLSDDAFNFLEPDFAFLSDDIIHLLKEIIENYNNEGDNLEMMLYGERRTIMDYLKFIKSASKAGDLKIIKKKITKILSFSDDQIQKVKNELPQNKPYEVDIHKEIAKKVKMKNHEVYKIIGIIINNA